MNEVLLALQDKQLLTNDRGRITIVDRPGLEAVGCECYPLVREEYDRLLG